MPDNPTHLDMLKRVMRLSDLEICQHLADIEGLQTYVQFSSIRCIVRDGDDYYFNPLDNNDQCFSLMEKYRVARTYEPYHMIGWSYHVVDGANPIHITQNQNFFGSGRPDLSIQKAVCLAIILNESDTFKVL